MTRLLGRNPVKFSLLSTILASAILIFLASLSCYLCVVPSQDKFIQNLPLYGFLVLCLILLFWGWMILSAFRNGLLGGFLALIGSAALGFIGFYAAVMMAWSQM